MERREKINIILDLDQSILSAEVLVKDEEDEEEEEEIYDIDKNRLKASFFNFWNMDNYYVIFERPGLQKFLDFLFKNFNVSVWTAASKSYCMFIVENILIQNRPERKLDHVFFSYHCKLSSKMKKGTKDLSMLWDVYKIPQFNSKNTIILDDYDEVSETNNSEISTEPWKCIFAKPFYFTEEGSENDDFLKILTKQLKIEKQNLLRGDVNAVRRIVHNS